MLLLSCTNLSRGYDATPLFEDVSFELHAGERVGLVGPNGAGKTTLLQDPRRARRAGRRARSRSTPAPGSALLAAGRGVRRRAARCSTRPSRPSTNCSPRRTSSSASPRSSRSAPTRRSASNSPRGSTGSPSCSATTTPSTSTTRSSTCSPASASRRTTIDREVRTFSGGQQRRLLLAKLLLAAPDVMLLDEPSNHLDIDTTRWLEDYLAQQPRGDADRQPRPLLPRPVVNKVFELHQRADHELPRQLPAVRPAARRALRAAS